VFDESYDSSWKTKGSLNQWAQRKWLDRFQPGLDNFLDNNKAPEYKKIVETLLDSFHKLVCNVSVKVHFYTVLIEYFSENLGALSEEHGERFTNILNSWGRDTKVDGA